MKCIATITLAAAIFSVVSHHHALAVPPNMLALGEMQTILALPVGDNPEGIAADKNGDIHVMIPGHVILEQLFGFPFAPLVCIDATSGKVTSTVFDDPEMPQFDVPLSLAFGTIGPEQESVFITNGDTLEVGGPGPRILQVGVGVEGFILRVTPRRIVGLIEMKNSVRRWNYLPG